MDLFYRTTFALCPAAAGGNDKGLAQWVGMPGGAGAGFERHTCTGGAGRCFGGEERIDADSAGEPFSGAFAGRLRADSFDFHGVLVRSFYKGTASIRQS